MKNGYNSVISAKTSFVENLFFVNSGFFVLSLLALSMAKVNCNPSIFTIGAVVLVLFAFSSSIVSAQDPTRNKYHLFNVNLSVFLGMMGALIFLVFGILNFSNY